eukprot:1189303-Prorocentrum_minimum.AAC.1
MGLEQGGSLVAPALVSAALHPAAPRRQRHRRPAPPGQRSSNAPRAHHRRRPHAASARPSVYIAPAPSGVSERLQGSARRGHVPSVKNWWENRIIE